MKLYDMLDCTKYDGNVYIVAIDKNEDEHFIFKGTFDDARKDQGVWDYLMCKIEEYYAYKNVIVIKFNSKDTWRSITGWNHIEKDIDKWIEDKKINLNEQSNCTRAINE